MTPLQLFKCLADETRLKSVLVINERKEVCVCELMLALNLDQPKVSRHLAELRKCQLLNSERRGKWVYYYLHESLPLWARELISNTAANNKPYFIDAVNALTTIESPADACL